MKKLILLCLSLLLTACGQGNPQSTLTSLADDKNALSIINKWVDSSNTIFDLSSYTLNIEASADTLAHCTGQSLGSALINGVDPSNVLISGTKTQGTIQFGFLNHINDSNPLCQAFDQALFQYSVNSEAQTMEICQGSVCQDFSLAH